MYFLWTIYLCIIYVFYVLIRNDPCLASLASSQSSECIEINVFVERLQTSVGKSSGPKMCKCKWSKYYFILFLCFINDVLIYNQHWKLSFGLLWMPKQIWASTQYFTAAQEWPCRSMSSHASWHIYNLQLSTSKITSYLQ